MNVEIFDADIDMFLNDEAKKQADNIVLDIVDSNEIRLSLFLEGHYRGHISIDLEADELYNNYTL